MTSLQNLVTALDRDRPLTAPPVLIRIVGPVADPVRVEENLAFDELIGFAAPSDCSAVGVVASGRATKPAGRPDAFAEPVNGGACDGERQRVRTTVIVERDGMALARLRWSCGRVVDEAPTSGRVRSGGSFPQARGTHRRYPRAPRAGWMTGCCVGGCSTAKPLWRSSWIVRSGGCRPSSPGASERRSAS